MRTKDKIIGCLMGGAIGDAFGLPWELRKNPIVDFSSVPRFLISDDTQLTLATCEAIIQHHRISPDTIAEKMSEWFIAEKIKGIGASTHKALEELASGGHWALVGRKGERAAGNGTAMRIAPVGFCLDVHNQNHRVHIRDISRITHHNDEACFGAYAILYAIQYACSGGRFDTQHVFEHIIQRLPDSKLRDRFLAIQAEPLSSPISMIGDNYGCSGYVVDSVPLAIYAATFINQTPFIEILHQLISVGGDTDTIASMSAQIMGAYLGPRDIIQTSFNQLEQADRILGTFESFADVSISISKSPS